MPDASLLEERWRSLVLAVRVEFWRDHRDPNVEFSSLFPLRLLRGALARPSGAPGGIPEWFERVVTDVELETSSAEYIAREFFDGFRRALGGSSPGGSSPGGSSPPDRAPNVGGPSPRRT